MKFVGTRLEISTGANLRLGGVDGTQFLRTKTDQDIEGYTPVEVITHLVHQQTASDATWIIDHNFNEEPSVTVTDPSGKVVVGEVSYPSKNRVQIDFAIPYAGRAILNAGSSSHLFASGQIQGVGGSLTPWQHKTANYTAAINDRVIADTTLAAWSLELPGPGATPEPGDEVTLLTLGASTNNLTILGSGYPVNGSTDPLVINSDRAQLCFVFLDAVAGWILFRSGTSSEAAAAEGIETFKGQIEIPYVGKEYLVDPSASYNYEVKSLVVGSDAGTGTATLKINGVPVGNIAGVQLDEGGDTYLAVAPMQANAGDRLTLSFPTLDGAGDIWFSIAIERKG